MRCESTRRPKGMGWKGSALLCAMSASGTLALAPQASAQGDKPMVVQTGEDGLPEKPPMVLQNRYFLKKLRPEVNLFGGQVLNESYNHTWVYGVRAGLFATEALGFEYTFEKYDAVDSPDLKALRRIEYCNDKGTVCKHPEPSFTRLRSGHLGTVTFAPIYGKVNLLDWIIVYSDIYANVGAGFLSTSDGSKPAAILGVGQRFYFAKSYNVRVDAVDHVFSETRVNGQEKKKNVRNGWTVSVGASAFLWD